MKSMAQLAVTYSSRFEEAVQLRIGLLEDSHEEAMAIERLLHANSMTVTRRTRGDHFLNLLSCDSFDLLILDWTLPDITGYEVLRRIRDDLRISVPILMHTARNDEMAVVQALDGGADDYLTKPWRPQELLARLRVLVRDVSSPLGSRTQKLAGGWVFDQSLCTVAFGGRLVRLPLKQFEVARLLFEHLGSPVSRKHLNERLWNGRANTRTIDTHVSKVRTLLKLNASNGLQLQTIYGFGYRLEPVSTPE